jgi:hypothetical protein
MNLQLDQGIKLPGGWFVPKQVNGILLVNPAIMRNIRLNWQ